MSYTLEKLIFLGMLVQALTYLFVDLSLLYSTKAYLSAFKQTNEQAVTQTFLGKSGKLKRKKQTWKPLCDQHAISEDGATSSAK